MPGRTQTVGSGLHIVSNEASNNNASCTTPLLFRILLGVFSPPQLLSSYIMVTALYCPPVGQDESNGINHQTLVSGTESSSHIGRNHLCLHKMFRTHVTDRAKDSGTTARSTFTSRVLAVFFGRAPNFRRNLASILRAELFRPHWISHCIPPDRT